MPRLTARPGGTAISALLLALVAGCRPADEPAAPVSFNWDVRPILSNHCFSCHGPDAAARKAGLRLDDPAVALAELAEHAGAYAIRPGDPAGSVLLERVTATDPDVVMPPPDANLALTAAQVDTLRRWIEQGAEYQRHWSFITPDVARPGSAGHPVDAFIDAAIAREGLRPAPAADRETLISRVTFSLTGLPPSPAEIDAFVADPDPDAYARLVDRLLASPAYGERMASEWLDAARYADSDGYLDDEYRRLLYPWRDWVISAFNDNLPYDRFGTMQLAGDLLENAGRDDLLASGFGRLHRRTAENGIIDEEYRVEYVIDRTDTLGTAFLGLSVGCARCHDHKFDPISHVDYYSLTAFFNSTDDAGFYPQEKWETGPTMYLADPATEAEIARLETAVTARTEALAAALDSARAALSNAPAGLHAPLADGTALSDIRAGLVEAERAHYSFDTVVEDAAAAAGYAGRAGLEPSQPLRFSAATTRGLRPAVLQAPVSGPGREGNALYFTANNRGFLDAADGVGGFDHPEPISLDFWLYPARVYPEAAVLNHDDHLRFGSGGWAIDLVDNRVQVSLVHAYPREQIVVRSAAALPAGEWTRLALTWDGAGRAAGLRLYFNGEPVALDVVRDGLTQSIRPLGIEFAGLDDFYGLSFGKRWQRTPLEGGAIDELRVFATELSPLAVAVLARGAAPLTATDAPAALADHLARSNPAVTAAVAAASAVRAELNTLLTGLPEVMVMGDTPMPRPTYVLERGLYSNPGEPVSPRGLTQIFPFAADLPANRLGLARWLFDPAHPLTARVYVNRLWQMHFGTGLVRTAEEFGLQGESPSHPELLDWLALEFIRSGWDIKAMQRLIVTSAAFRRDSTERPGDAEADPENRWLARGVVRRLTAEMIRDNALAASGLLNPTLGGPSVFPYQPEGVWEAINFYARDRAYPAPESVPNDHHRRSLYSMVRRGAPVPSMTIFDFPRRHMARVRRPTSNTPLQALVLLNDPQYVEAARGLAERTFREAGTTLEARLGYLFRLAARRQPEAAELEVLGQYHATQLAAFAADPAGVTAYLDIGVLDPDPTLDPVQLAALGATASVLFNTPDSYLLR